MVDFDVMTVEIMTTLKISSNYDANVASGVAAYDPTYVLPHTLLI